MKPDTVFLMPAFLLGPDGSVSPVVREFLWDLRARGIRVLLAAPPEGAAHKEARRASLAGLLDGAETFPAPGGSGTDAGLSSAPGQAAFLIAPSGRILRPGENPASPACGGRLPDPDVEALRRELKLPRGIRRGFFLSFEGGDGSGKSTQTDLLEASLRRLGYPVQKTREPGGCPVSERIREILLFGESDGMQEMTEAYLYAAARAQHVREVIRPALEAGRVLLCDRFVDSSIAYQGGGRGLGTDLVERLNAPAVDGCMPDMTVYLDLDPVLAHRRRRQASEADRIERLDEAFRIRVRDAYGQLISRDAGRYAVVDASGDSGAVAERVLAVVLERLARWEAG